mgnify:CR=1 FL=1
MTAPDNIVLEITPEVLLKAYACGIFPMAESAEDPGLYWIEPERRGILPLDAFHLPRRLKRTVRKIGGGDRNSGTASQAPLGLFQGRIQSPESRHHHEKHGPGKGQTLDNTHAVNCKNIKRAFL